MGNKGAFITLTKTLKPTFTTYEAVVSDNILRLAKHYIPPCIAPSQSPSHAICQPIVLYVVVTGSEACTSVENTFLLL